MKTCKEIFGYVNIQVNGDGSIRILDKGGIEELIHDTYGVRLSLKFAFTQRERNEQTDCEFTKARYYCDEYDITIIAVSEDESNILDFVYIF
jgi:hypothetical protein